jgi:hypothetical protein
MPETNLDIRITSDTISNCLSTVTHRSRVQTNQISSISSYINSAQWTDRNNSTRNRKIRQHFHAINQTICSENTQYNNYSITLNYNNSTAYDKSHITNFHKALREFCRRRNINYRLLWRLEFGEINKREHYHCALWIDPSIKLADLPINKWWKNGWINKQRTRHITKWINYISKPSGAIPASFRGSRLYGHGGLSLALTETFRYYKAPQWIKDAVVMGDKIRKQGKWYNINKEIKLRSPWVCRITDGKLEFDHTGFTEEHIRLLKPSSDRALTIYLKLIYNKTDYWC